MIQQTPTSTTFNDQVEINGLYDAWSNLETNFNTRPITQTEVGAELGQSSGLTNAYDPNCIDNALDDDGNVVDCPDGSNPFNIIANQGRSSNHVSKAALIGIIVGVIVASFVIFAIFVCALMYCKHRNIGLFSPDLRDEPVEQELTPVGNKNNHTDLNSKASDRTHSDSIDVATDHHTAAPTQTRGTADLIPINDDEQLPDGWTKQQHIGTGDIFYVHQEKMISQKHAPGTTSTVKGRWF